MTRAYLEPTGARENHLRDASVRVPERTRRAVTVVGHDLDVVAHADHVIDLGPDGGDAGDPVVPTGTPAQRCAAPGPHTATHPARHVVG